ncbi:FMN-binding protein [Galactobacillus timonensis]|uniref:FMN-binding protein n=1 Tax=Galactobacillus timonensis TaxID=2041840 RepID=UPI000C820833|nr:FMN-binding protein [Galactobacillus timonensis]
MGPASRLHWGTADGFGGTITAKVTVDESGKITDLVLTGEDETPDSAQHMYVFCFVSYK